MPAPDTNDLTDLVSVEQFLALQAGNADESLIQGLITAVSAEIVTYCERGSFMSQSRLETRNGNGRRSMEFLNPPCIAVGSLTINTEVIPAALDETSYGYTFDADRIYIRETPSGSILSGRAAFERGYQNIRLVYTGGYFTPGQSAAGQPQMEGVAVLPADLKMAATEMVALRYRQSKRWGETGFGIGGERVNYFTGGMSAATKQKLDRYRRVVPIDA
jgi:hypothetical protein